jgi:hypothetical protein
MAWRYGAGVALAFLAATTGCGETPDELARLTGCLRKHDTHVVDESPTMARLARRKGWKMQSLRVGANELTIVATPTTNAAEQAQTTLRKARDAIDPNRPPPHRRGKLVYWWTATPSGSERAVFQACGGS